jgi:hypothetical protein
MQETTARTPSGQPHHSRRVTEQGSQPKCGYMVFAGLMPIRLVALVAVLSVSAVAFDTTVPTQYGPVQGYRSGNVRALPALRLSSHPPVADGLHAC